ncbi:Hypothetical_protein [Hexamita inflata]|uniref:Hypothetical_protein n=1 Tax=Hexamita inflata TaxID=28002 RepID=A0AA86Q1Q3_9EUKA|nr:Hypothetical protein HINF_LOCUS36671 [Hexamita inflata]
MKVDTHLQAFETNSVFARMHVQQVLSVQRCLYEFEGHGTQFPPDKQLLSAQRHKFYVELKFPTVQQQPDWSKRGVAPTGHDTQAALLFHCKGEQAYKANQNKFNISIIGAGNYYQTTKYTIYSQLIQVNFPICTDYKNNWRQLRLLKPSYPIFSIIYYFIQVIFHCFHSDDESIIDKEESRITYAASEDQLVIIKLIMIYCRLGLSQSLNNHYIIAHNQSDVRNRLSLIFSFVFTNNYGSF